MDGESVAVLQQAVHAFNTLEVHCHGQILHDFTPLSLGTDSVTPTVTQDTSQLDDVYTAPDDIITHAHAVVRTVDTPTPAAPKPPVIIVEAPDAALMQLEPVDPLSAAHTTHHTSHVRAHIPPVDEHGKDGNNKLGQGYVSESSVAMDTALALQRDLAELAGMQRIDE